MRKQTRTALPDLTQEQREILEKIYELYYEQMLAKAYRILGNKQDAEDAVQEAFYHVCLNVEKFAALDSDAVAALIHTYTRNSAINHYHRKKRQRALILEGKDADHSAAPDEYDLALLVEWEETADRVRRAVDMLEPMYKEVIVLKYYEHKTNSEIALLLGLSRNLVNGRMFRAKKLLRAMLEAHE